MFYLFIYFLNRLFVETNKCCGDYSGAPIKWLPEKCTKTQHIKRDMQSYTAVTTGKEQMTCTRGSLTNTQCQCAPSREGHSTEQGAGGICSMENISGCRAAQWPERLLPLSPLSAHLSHLITLRLCLCACILGNLPPTMERALASAWEEYGAMERKSKAEWDTERWKTGREAGQ